MPTSGSGSGSGPGSGPVPGFGQSKSSRHLDDAAMSGVAEEERGQHLWRPCFVRDPGPDGVLVQWEDGCREQVMLHPHEVFHERWDACGTGGRGGSGSRLDRCAFTRRVQRALSRRRDCEALLTYRHYVSCMPVDPAVTGTLQKGPANRAMALALRPFNGSKGNGGKVRERVRELLAEVTREYQLCISALVFDCNMMNRANIRTYEKLKLPPPPPPKPVPERAVVHTPPHEFQGISETFGGRTFLTSSVALTAALCVRRECLWIVDVRALSTQHQEPRSLHIFSHRQGDALARAKRIIREEWPQRVGSSVHQALRCQLPAESVQKTMDNPFPDCQPLLSLGGGGLQAVDERLLATGAPQGGIFRPRFDQSITTTDSYEASEIRRFLQWANYNMTDALQEVTRSSLDEFARYILRCSSCEVEVRGTNEVVVTDSGDEGMRRSSVPPVFRVDIVRSESKHVLNQAQVEETRRGIADWRTTVEAKGEDAVCPFAEASEPGIIRDYDHGTSHSYHEPPREMTLLGVGRTGREALHDVIFLPAEGFRPTRRKISSVVGFQTSSSHEAVVYTVPTYYCVGFLSR